MQEVEGGDSVKRLKKKLEKELDEELDKTNPDFDRIIRLNFLLRRL